MYKLAAVLFILMIFVGCESNGLPSNIAASIGNPTADKVLKTNPTANILQYNDIIYSAGVAWVDELELTKEKQLTEINQQLNDGLLFENQAANQLKIGTKIFSVKERGDILIAETEDGDIRFYNLVEG